jgi:anti-sigma factor RsiW
MADRGGAVEVHGSVAVSGAVADGKDPDALVAQIESTREDLARAIDALADRVSPANNIRKLRERAAEQAARPEVRIAAAALGAAVVGLAILRIWSRRRR